LFEINPRIESCAFVQEGKMKFVPGQVVNLKSGGQPLTVVAVDGDSVEYMWLGEEGDLFRESIPAIAIELAFGDDTANLDSADERAFANANALASDDDDEEDEDEEDGEEDEEDEDEEEEDDDEEDEDDDEEEDEDKDEDEEDEAEEDRALEEIRGQPAPAAPRRRRVPA
jgi:uncharacterized protein YodC (DUF2158 family)